VTGNKKTKNRTQTHHKRQKTDVNPQKKKKKARVIKPIEPGQLIAWFKDDEPDFAPGAGFGYCNSAYFLLGELVAKVSGQPLGEYFRAAFFEPLEMKDTGIYVNSAPPPNMARGYSFASDKVEPAIDWDMSWAGGAGALYSTVGDLYRWNEALFGGRVLSEPTLRAALTPVELPPDVDGMKYGYGLILYDVQRLPAVGHGGGLSGWASDLVRIPEQRVTVVVLSNALPPPPGLAPQEISRTFRSSWRPRFRRCRSPRKTRPSIENRFRTMWGGTITRQRL
jgi:CubicO group peptidase (beta-lactamase class C family)